VSIDVDDYLKDLEEELDSEDLKQFRFSLKRRAHEAKENVKRKNDSERDQSS